jgi:phage gp29-like protein
MAKDEQVQKIANVWAKMMSPLRGLTQQQITQMLENARHGNDVRMQLAFFEMERQTPIYQVCL